MDSSSIYLVALWICLGFVSIESLAVDYIIKHVCKSLSFSLLLNPLLKCSWWSLILELREIISHFPFPWRLCLLYLITASPAVISTSLPKAKPTTKQNKTLYMEIGSFPKSSIIILILSLAKSKQCPSNSLTMPFQDDFTPHDPRKENTSHASSHEKET